MPLCFNPAPTDFPNQSDHVDGSVGLEEGQLEAAVSGVIYEEIEESKTVAAAANQALLHHLRRVSSSFSKLVHL